jgi:hypothetical protein
MAKKMLQLEVKAIKLHKVPNLHGPEYLCKHLYPTVARGEKIPNEKIGDSGCYQDGDDKFVATLCLDCSAGYRDGAAFEIQKPPFKEGPMFDNVA